ncbi:uracil-DNA glycosylase [Rhodanobacter sp. BL-MT-08]
MNTDRAKLLGESGQRATRLQQINESHIAPLTAFVETLRMEAGPDASIPYFDPWDGGVEAKILFLLEAPGPKAVGSGFISRNNPEETAKNFFELSTEAQIPRKETVIWNSVPWYIGTGTKIRAATPSDLEAGLRPLPRLLELLPKLQAVVFVGKKAERARAQVEKLRPELRLLTCPHPSPLFVNNAPGNKERILLGLREVADLIAANVV